MSATAENIEKWTSSAFWSGCMGEIKVLERSQTRKFIKYSLMINLASSI